MLAHDALVRLGVACVTLVRTHDAGDFSRTLVRGSGHQAGDRTRERAPTIAVVGQAGCHQQGAEVGVADTELTVVASGVANGFRGEVGEADGDIHRGDDELDGTTESVGVEGVVVAQELHQVEAGEVARGVVE